MWFLPLLLALFLGCTPKFQVIDCDPAKRTDCRSVSPEGISYLGSIIEMNEVLQVQLEKCEKRSHPQVNYGSTQ